MGSKEVWLTISMFWKRNWGKIAAVYGFFAIVFAITFYKTSFFSTLLYSTRIYFYFVALPALVYSMFYEDMEFHIFLIYAVSYFAATILLSYYLALFGLNVRYHAIAVPLVLIAISYVAARLRSAKKGEQKKEDKASD